MKEATIKMKIEKYSIPGLYYHYKTCDDDQIRNYLKTIKIVRLENKGIGTIQGYYALNAKAMKKILDNPRNNSLTFDATETKLHPIKNLCPYKKFVFLVKSTSRFFLKPDIGEVFDVIHRFRWNDHNFNQYKAICIDDDYETLEDTAGEHFLMTATLFV